jgi:hypothetical protein
MTEAGEEIKRRQTGRFRTRGMRKSAPSQLLLLIAHAEFMRCRSGGRLAGRQIALVKRVRRMLVEPTLVVGQGFPAAGALIVVHATQHDRCPGCTTRDAHALFSCPEADAGGPARLCEFSGWAQIASELVPLSGTILSKAAELFRSLHQALLARCVDLGRRVRVRHPVELGGGEVLGSMLLAKAVPLLVVSGQRLTAFFGEAGGFDASLARRSDRNRAVRASVCSKASWYSDFAATASRAKAARRNSLCFWVSIIPLYGDAMSALQLARRNKQESRFRRGFCCSDGVRANPHPSRRRAERGSSG